MSWRFGPGKMSPFTNSPLTLQFPKVSGCYIISYAGKVLYVGQSGNIKQRWLTHHQRCVIEQLFPTATVEIVACGDDRFDTEKELIEKLKPIMNGHKYWHQHKNELLERVGLPHDA